MKKGDKVQYSAKFLKSIFCYTGDLPHAKGEIIEIEKIGSLKLAVVNWDGLNVPNKVNIKNLKLLHKSEID